MKAFRKWLWDSGADLLIIPAITVCAIIWLAYEYPAYEQAVSYTITVTVTP